MANKNAAFGLKAVRMMGGAPYSGGQSRYRIASGATTPIYNGDLVTQLTAGVIGRHAASGTVPVVGVFNGVSYTDPTSGEQVFKNYYPGSIAASDIVASVIDDSCSRRLLSWSAKRTCANHRGTLFHRRVTDSLS